jgi:hypothetical protein
MKKVLVAFLFSLPIVAVKAQNVGINTTSPQASLDVYGDIILRSADLVAADGINAALDVNNNRFSYYRISGPTADFRLAGITAGVEGRLITLFNRSGFTMQLNNQDGNATDVDRIITGNNADLDINDRGIVNLQYDGLEQRWIVLSNNKAGGAVSGGWGLNGNTGTNPASDFIGTTDNQPFIIKSFNQKIAEFQYGFPSNIYLGNNFNRVGIGVIGTGAPTHTLEVGLADLAGGSQGVLGIRGTSHMSHFNYGADEDVYIRGGKNGSKIVLNDISGLGNVGIGISNPEYKLHLRAENENTMKIDGQNSLVLFHDKTTNAQYGFLRAWTDAPFNPAGYYGLEIGVPPIVGSDNPKRLMFSTNYALRMVIMENGNVGIGTNNPTNKLSVNGDIRSREVTVELINWPDYVFKKTYHLRPLQEVESFIQNNHRLPDIPSAAEIEKNGLQLGDMQKRIMEKIEELTLYILQQQKEIEQLKKHLPKTEK